MAKPLSSLFPKEGKVCWAILLPLALNSPPTFLMKAFTSLKTVAALNGGQTSPFYLEIKYLVVVLRFVHLDRQWSQERTGKVPTRTGTDVEMLTSLILYLLLRSKKDCIYQDKFHFILDGPYSAGK